MLRNNRPGKALIVFRRETRAHSVSASCCGRKDRAMWAYVPSSALPVELGSLEHALRLSSRTWCQRIVGGRIRSASDSASEHQHACEKCQPARRRRWVLCPNAREEVQVRRLLHLPLRRRVRGQTRHELKVRRRMPRTVNDETRDALDGRSTTMQLSAWQLRPV